MTRRILTEIPGPRSRELARRLAEVEGRSVTFFSDRFPVFWASGAGATVTDVDGNEFLDMTAAFGVAILGHGAPPIASAVAVQARRLAHGMGDVHPTELRVAAAERLVSFFPRAVSWRVLFGLSGSDAVELALETAILATGRARAIALAGAYHGLSLGALDLTHRAFFRDPFRERLPSATTFLPFPTESTANSVLEVLRRAAPEAGIVLIEPIQGRGGIRELPSGFLGAVSRICRESGTLLGLDEIYTGCGRTGFFCAFERDLVLPDLVMVGKGLAGGLPLSALVGRSEVVDAWPASTGEALRTSTFLGHPLALAAAVTVLDRIAVDDLPGRARLAGERLLAALAAVARRHDLGPPRGRGLFLGLEVGPGRGVRVMEEALARGLFVLPEGDRAEVVSFTPPLVITDREIDEAVGILDETLAMTPP